MKIINLNLLLLILFQMGCTHYRSISSEDLINKNLLGRWEMSMEPYFIDIDCNGKMSFVKPSSNFLYADQKGSDFVITELKEQYIIAGPIIRTTYKMEEWPHDENGRMVMTMDGRIWHLATKYSCKD